MPREFLSWTQLSVYESSIEQYKKIYLDGERMPINRGMALGKQMADALKDDEETGDAVTDLVISQLPKFPLMDKEFLVPDFKVADLTIPLRAFIDSARIAAAAPPAFKEYKTGTTAWDQAKVDSAGQITFYWIVLTAITGMAPDDVELIWMPTEKDGSGRVHFTGEIKRFPTTRTYKDVLNMKMRMHKAWTGIAELVEKTIV